MGPAQGVEHWPGRARRVVHAVEARVGVGLENPGPARQVRLGVLARAVARVAERRRLSRRLAGADGVRRSAASPRAGGARPAKGRSSRTYAQIRPVAALPLASTGTVVSSPCSRPAASTCRSSSAPSGASVAQAWPTWSARVDRLTSSPSRAKRSAWRLSGWCWPYFSNKTVASRLGPAQPRGVGWNGAGGWAIASQSRQLKRSRTVWTTFQRAGTRSAVSVTVSPSLLSRVDPQHGQLVGAGSTTRSRGRWAGKGLRDGLRRAGAPAIRSAAASSSPAEASSSSSWNSSWSRSRAVRSERVPKSWRRSFSTSSRRWAISAWSPEALALAEAASASAASARARASASAARRASMSSGGASMGGV
jgi:hypothetical protein